MPEICILDSPEEVAQIAASRFIDAGRKALASMQRFSVALSGGSTPRRVYQLLASDLHKSSLNWSSTHIFFGDERCVPANDSASNYRLASETMISRLPIAAENVHPIRGEGDPVKNAEAYDLELRTFFANLSWARFDLVLLGLGDDGHTASLFPQTSALRERRRWVVANWVEKLNSFRITLTVPAINHAAEILFLVTGKEKANALNAVLRGPRQPERYPAQFIQPEDGTLTWLVDKEAASTLGPA
jgi:6-phosphogluconolactonase